MTEKRYSRSACVSAQVVILEGTLSRVAAQF